MAKSPPQIDVLVLGQHPSAYLAAALLRHKSHFHIVHSTIPTDRAADRLLLVNPALFHLHPLLEPLRRKLPATTIYGARFLSDEDSTAEFRSRSGLNLVASLRDAQTECEKLAAAQEVSFLRPRQLTIHRIDEKGIELTADGKPLKPKALVLAGALPPDQQRILGLPDEWERGILRRYTYARMKPGRLIEKCSRPIVPMSLDLRHCLCWGWMLPGRQWLQLAVEQPVAASAAPIAPRDLLAHWVGVLRKHSVLKADPPTGTVESIDLPMAGALAHEGLANRTLLVGPAGGFYSGSGEDLYPNCWSALFAAEVMKKALKEPHLQDALQPYRQRWRTTLGEYLRGPQANLRFLLPLVYRNQVMTNRIAEAILVGQKVVR